MLPAEALPDSEIVLLRGDELIRRTTLGAGAGESLEATRVVNLLYDAERGGFDVWLFGLPSRIGPRDESLALRQVRRVPVGPDGQVGVPVVFPLPDEPATLLVEAVAATDPPVVFARAEGRLVRWQASSRAFADAGVACPGQQPCALPLGNLGYHANFALHRVQVIVDPSGRLVPVEQVPGLAKPVDRDDSLSALVRLGPDLGPIVVRTLHREPWVTELYDASGERLAVSVVQQWFTPLLRAARGGDGPLCLLSKVSYNGQLLVPWKDGLFVADFNALERRGASFDVGLRTVRAPADANGWTKGPGRPVPGGSAQSAPHRG